jgi:hypothetical protein
MNDLSQDATVTLWTLRRIGGYGDVDTIAQASPIQQVSPEVVARGLLELEARGLARRAWGGWELAKAA